MAEIERLPFEDLDASLYLHDRDKLVVVTVGGEASYSVEVGFFMEVQRQRDAYRRTLGLVNAAVRRGNVAEAVGLLDMHGGDEFGAKAAKAIDEVVAWALSDR